MNQKLLKDKIYLTLLAFYDNKLMPSYTALGKQTGVTRQTVAKRVNQLIQEGIIAINEERILLVKNEEQLDKEYLKSVLEKEHNILAIQMALNEIPQSQINVYKTAKQLSVSPQTIYSNIEARGIVYGIVSEGIIKYVGSTKHFEERIRQHIKKRPFLERKNFIILKEIDLDNRFDYEKQLIKILQPEWNIMSKTDTQEEK